MEFEEKYKGWTIGIDVDDFEIGEGPRDWDNLGHMICFHLRYDLGDQHNYTPDEIGVIVRQKGVICLPLYLLDHSGLWISTGQYTCDPGGWDTSHIGYIYVTHEEIRKEWGWKRLTAQRIGMIQALLDKEVITYNQWLTGGVLYYEITDPTGEHFDSCGGIYDDEKTIIHDCKNLIDHEIVKRAFDIQRIEIKHAITTEGPR